MQEEQAINILEKLLSSSLKDDYDRVITTYGELCNKIDEKDSTCQEVKEKLKEHKLAIDTLKQNFEVIDKNRDQGLVELLQSINRESNRKIFLKQLQEGKDNKMFQIALDNKTLELENKYLKKSLEGKQSNEIRWWNSLIYPVTFLLSLILILIYMHMSK